MDAQWRTSSYTTAGGTCVEVAIVGDDAIAVRNSNFPDRGTILFTRAEMDAWIKGVKDGEFDDLT
ncbi:DUF397 domain-containing protein [Dactylosporangium sp. NBC_01737]|uniref:DUF397 domain-containing protein n=1 Tax=Dactylosporangium sp. NBC_01737 TaxID=2975959 RepID=UPI002E124D7D|nr:DUF397 domain-containing protein [Dactylosporangium sp. NBC_01737]